MFADRPIGDRRRPDIASAVLITAAMALLVWAPTRGAAHGWTSAGFLIAAGGGFLLLGLLALAETRSRDPLLRPGMLRSRWLAGTVTATTITGVLTGGTILLITLFLQQTAGYSPLQAGLAFGPAGLAGVLVARRYAGPILTRVGPRLVLAAALSISAVAIAWLSRFPGGGDYLPLLPLLIAIGVRLTTAAVATTAAVSSPSGWAWR